MGWDEFIATKEELRIITSKNNFKNYEIGHLFVINSDQANELLEDNFSRSWKKMVEGEGIVYLNGGAYRYVVACQPPENAEYYKELRTLRDVRFDADLPIDDRKHLGAPIEASNVTRKGFSIKYIRSGKLVVDKKKLIDRVGLFSGPDLEKFLL